MEKNIEQTIMKQKISYARIGRETTLNGTLSFEKQLHIYGKFTGHIRGGDLLVIDRGAHIDATIEVNTLVIHGSVQGNINARTSVTLEVGSIVRADIQAKSIRITGSAQYQGTCMVISESETA